MLLISLLYFLGVVVTGVFAIHPHGMVVYWGQNASQNQKRLKDYCDKDSVDILVVAFVNGFPNLIVNFANMCGDTFSSGLLNCPDIGSDIKYCQDKGKIVLLSLGGASGAYGFQNDQQGREFAQVMYDTFGPGNAKERPFGDAIVNGYDLDLEAGNTGYAAFAEELNKLHENVDYPYFLSAAPQCVYPDSFVGDALDKAYFSAVFIQFYNNYCNLDKGAAFNLMTSWKNWAETKSVNPDVLMFIGLPGNQASAGSGYVTVDQVKQVVGPEILGYDKFGGFMLWDISSSEANTDSEGNTFDQQLKNFLISA